MAFIKTSWSPEEMVGKEAILKRDVSAIKGTITKGSRVKVTGCWDRGFSVRDIKSGEEIIDCGFDCIEWGSNAQ